MAARSDTVERLIAQLLAEQRAVMVSIAADSGAVLSEMAVRLGRTTARLSQMKKEGEKLRRDAE